MDEKEIVKELNKVIDSLNGVDLSNIADVMLSKYTPSEQQEIKQAMKDIEAQNLKTK
jgi:hypothetical protein